LGKATKKLALKINKIKIKKVVRVIKIKLIKVANNNKDKKSSVFTFK